MENWCHQTTWRLNLILPLTTCTNFLVPGSQVGMYNLWIFRLIHQLVHHHKRNLLSLYHLWWLKLTHYKDANKRNSFNHGQFLRMSNVYVWFQKKYYNITALCRCFLLNPRNKNKQLYNHLPSLSLVYCKVGIMNEEITKMKCNEDGISHRKKNWVMKISN